MKIKLHLSLLLIFIFCFQQGHGQFLLKGTVKDVKGGKGISGVTVLEKGTINGTSTDASGRFVIELKKDTATLAFSSIGYLTKEIGVKKGFIDNFIIELHDDSVEFDSLLASHTIYPLAIMGLSSGLKYTPFGLAIRNYRTDYSIVPFYINEISYRTDLNINNSFYAAVSRNISNKRRSVLNIQANFQSLNVSFSEKEYQQNAVSILFGRWFANIFYLRIGPSYQHLIFNDQRFKQMGGRVMLQKFINLIEVNVSTSLAVYPQFNNFSFSAEKNIFWRINIEGAFEKLKDYQELRISLTYSIY